MSQSTLTAPITDAVAPPTLHGLIRSIGPDPTYSECDRLEHLAEEVVVRAFRDGDEAADLDAHRFLYEIYAHQIRPPWSEHHRDYDHPAVQAAHRRVADAWLAHEQAEFATRAEMPSSVDDFAEWATRTCEEHASGVTHPLFDFLAERADFAQLTRFIDQETPFDIHFGDLVALLLAGMHDGPKIELAGNFWDEMGCGTLAVTHRNLRLNMMRRIGVPADTHLLDVEHYWVEELRMANMYFQTSGQRRLAPQAIGMLLATELVVPGRIDRQIDGWRRTGLADDEMRYLLEHVTVDVEHAQGWLDNVVVPLLHGHPELMPEMVLGVTRRLDAALRVCDRAVRELDRSA